MEKEPIISWLFRVFGRIFLTMIVPFYGGYVAAPILNMLGYVLAVGATSLYFFGRPGPKQLVHERGMAGLLLGWLLMSLVVLIGAAPAFAIGYFVHWANSN